VIVEGTRVTDRVAKCYNVSGKSSTLASAKTSQNNSQVIETFEIVKRNHGIK